MDLDKLTLPQLVTDLKQAAANCAKCEGTRETVFTARGRDNCTGKVAHAGPPELACTKNKCLINNIAYIDHGPLKGSGDLHFQQVQLSRTFGVVVFASPFLKGRERACRRSHHSHMRAGRLSLRRPRWTGG